jgi:hypothetical protein
MENAHQLEVRVVEIAKDADQVGGLDLVADRALLLVAREVDLFHPFATTAQETTAFIGALGKTVAEDLVALGFSEDDFIWRRHRSDLSQRLLEIGKQVGRVLAADRETDQGVRRSKRLTSQAGVAHRGRVSY